MNHKAPMSFLWLVADRFRGDWKQADYAKVIPHVAVQRRLDCVLGPTEAALLGKLAHRRARGMIHAPPSPKNAARSSPPLSRAMSKRAPSSIKKRRPHERPRYR